MIRKARYEDLPVLLEIYNKEITTGTATFYTEKISAESWREWYKNKSSLYPIYVFEADGMAVAYVMLSPFGKEKEIAYSISAELSIYIHSNYRGKGIGGKLMQHMIESARSINGIENIISTITSDNTDSIHLHRKVGFEHIGRIRHAAKKFGRILEVDYYQLVL